MSGNEPYSDESSEFADPASGDIYGAPRSNIERAGPAAGELAAPLPKDGDGGGIDLRDTPSLGNRPASGARVVSVSEVFSEHFIGAEGASDFLGLDTEFDPTPVGSPGSSSFVMADVARATATEEEYQRGLMSPLSAPDANPSYLAPAPAAYDDGGLPPAPLDDLPPEDDAFSADDPLSEDFDFEPAVRRSRKGLVVGVLCALGAAAAAAYFVLPGLSGGKDAEPAPVVARKTPDRAPAEADPVPAPVDAEVPVPAEPEPRPLEDFGSGVPLEEPTDPFADPLASGEGPLPELEPAPELLPGETEGDASGVEPITATELSELEVFLSQNLDQNMPDHGGMLDLVWRGETVPLSAISSPNRILTPAVGPVRVHLLSNTVFDGRLFAVGQDKVWVDAGLGRMGIDGAQVERIESLPKDAILTDDGGLEEVVMGERVRARVAGGVIYGYVRSQRGNEVTLVTVSGARITLVDAVIEAAGDPKRVALKL